MPLSEKARIEVYLPDLPTPAYRDLLDALDQEFTYTPFAFEENFARISHYADELRDAAHEALDEEAALVVVLRVYHADAGV